MSVTDEHPTVSFEDLPDDVVNRIAGFLYLDGPWRTEMEVARDYAALARSCVQPFRRLTESIAHRRGPRATPMGPRVTTLTDHSCPTEMHAQLRVWGMLETPQNPWTQIEREITRPVVPRNPFRVYGDYVAHMDVSTCMRDLFVTAEDMRARADDKSWTIADVRACACEKYGGRAGWERERVRREEEDAAVFRKCEARRLELVRALRRHGLGLRSDSRLCAQYIRGTIPDTAEDVARTMVEMKFLVEHTNYRRIMRRNIQERRIESRCVDDGIASYDTVDYDEVSRRSRQEAFQEFLSQPWADRSLLPKHM